MWSLDPGRISAFAEFDVFRSPQLDFSTVWKASTKGMLEGASLGEDHRRNNVLTKCSNQTMWFEMFVRGVELQVGSKSRPDHAINIEVMKLIKYKM